MWRALIAGQVGRTAAYGIERITGTEWYTLDRQRLVFSVADLHARSPPRIGAINFLAVPGGVVVDSADFTIWTGSIPPIPT